MSALLSATEIRLSYGYQMLLDGVTLAISGGEKVGMVGRNGCGKTSLLKILSGMMAADSGDIALRRALACQPDLLLLDEPTNHLDAESIRWLEAYLKGFAGAVIFVTHDRYFLDEIATRILEIDLGRAFSHPGNYTAFLESKAVRQQIAEQTERRRQRFLREELDWVRSGVKARGTKSRHRMDQYYEIEGMEAPPEEREMDLLIPPPPDLGNIVVELENAGVNIAGTATPRWLFRHLTLTLRPGQCTGIVGRNGVGKTTLLKLCLGQIPASEGSAVIGKRVKVNYIDQTRMQLDGTGSLLDEISDGNEKLMFGNQPLGARLPPAFSFQRSADQRPGRLALRRRAGAADAGEGAQERRQPDRARRADQ